MQGSVQRDVLPGLVNIRVCIIKHLFFLLFFIVTYHYDNKPIGHLS